MQKASVYLLCFFCSMLCSIELLAASGSKKKLDKETECWKYEVEAVATGVQGSYQLKVWTYAKRPEDAIAQAKKNAVHAVIFKGFPSKDRVAGQKPLVSNSSVVLDKAQFFDHFFEDTGGFEKYVFLANNGSIAATDRIKLGRKSYKIGMIVSVNVAGLREELEAAGVIRKLSSGF
ncbi:hypothetical protein K5X82_05735 [Halosquirtibacter xylanolyticus]|uniref:hypothetical protein n=1 Tax=Halosquirtibacter xylanolyticus TaxID=3374599 RepID=UPI00374A49A9|nr:hypothetical protein K5X82_05735 [Prolixibacteraceae bacterium]